MPDQYEIHFLARIAPLGTATYFVVESDNVHPVVEITETSKSEPEVKLHNENLEIKLSPEKGTITSMKLNGQEKEFEHKYMQYKSSHKGGAYIFAPQGEASLISPQHSTVTVIKVSAFKRGSTLWHSIAAHRCRNKFAKYLGVQNQFVDILTRVKCHFDTSPRTSCGVINCNFSIGAYCWVSAGSVDERHQISCQHLSTWWHAKSHGNHQHSQFTVAQLRACNEVFQRR